MSKTPEEMLAIMNTAKSKPKPESSTETPFESLLREQIRTNSLLIQLKKILLGLPLGSDGEV